MKDQYVGDIGDYGKYGLLRFLAKRGLRIGINWYLTENDRTVDGKFTKYLKDQRKDGDMQYDEELFRLLQPIVDKGINKKTVQDVEQGDIIPDAVFFNEWLHPCTAAEREAWHARAMQTLLGNNVDLIFADPDNGTLSEKREQPRKISEKHALLKELRAYYNQGKDVVYYCHKGRRKLNAWQEKMDEFNVDGHDARIIVLTLHRGTQRSFIFAVHQDHYETFDGMINEFLSGAWGTVKVDGKKLPFSRETVL